MRGFVSAQNVDIGSHWLKKEEKRKAVINMFRRGRAGIKATGREGRQRRPLAKDTPTLDPAGAVLARMRFTRTKAGESSMPRKPIAGLLLQLLPGKTWKQTLIG